MHAFPRNRRVIYSCVSAVAMVVIVLIMTTAALAGIRWSSNGVGICTQANQQWAPQIASDGWNGAIITWQDNRNGDWDIYAQHVSSGGTVDSTWPVDGVPVCTAAGDQQGACNNLRRGARGDNRLAGCPFEPQPEHCDIRPASPGPGSRLIRSGPRTGPAWARTSLAAAAGSSPGWRAMGQTERSCAGEIGTPALTR